MSEITIPLDVFERRFLVMLSERERAVIMNHDLLTPDVIEALKVLETKGAIRSEKNMLVGVNKYRYHLTDMGTNLVDMIKEKTNV